MRAINDKCNNCGACIKVCPVEGCITRSDIYRIDPAKCIDCMACVDVCKQNAIVEYEPIETEEGNELEI